MGTKNKKKWSIALGIILVTAIVITIVGIVYSIDSGNPTMAINTNKSVDEKITVGEEIEIVEVYGKNFRHQADPLNAIDCLEAKYRNEWVRTDEVVTERIGNTVSYRKNKKCKHPEHNEITLWVWTLN